MAAGSRLRFLACIAVASLRVVAAEAEDAVLTLTTSNFDEAVKNTKRLLVEFYAPWCGHCKALEPEYKKAAEEMKQEKLETVLAKVDATEHKELQERFGIQSYPTLKYFVQGQDPVDFGGGRTADGIKSWLKKREVPPYKEIAEGDVESFLSEAQAGEFAFVARIGKKSARGKAFFTALDGLVEYEAVTVKVAVVYLPKTADPKTGSSLVAARPGFEDPDPVRLTYDGKWTDSAILAWIKTSTYPSVGQKFKGNRYGSSSAESVGKDGSVVVLVKDGDGRQKVLPELLALAKAEPRWLFTTSVVGDLQEHELQEVGAKSGEPPMAAVLHKQKKYVLKGGEEAIAAPGAIKSLLESVKTKKAKPYYKSATVPAPEVDENGVTTLVGETFEKHVLNSKKDVFVEFYAPWCGHCQKLAPVWNDLGKMSKDRGWSEKGVVIAKMDATENESDEDVDGFPKLVLYPAVKADKKFKTKLVYGGARELDKLADFLLENTKALEGAEESGGSGGKAKKYSMVDREREKRKRKQAGNEL